MLVLGIQFGHGASVALVADGKAVAAIEEEKLRRIKGFVGFPCLGVDYVLSRAGLELGDVDFFALGMHSVAEFSYGFVHLACNIFNSQSVWRRKSSRALDLLKQTFPLWDTSRPLERLFFKELEKSLGIPRGKVIKVNHHLAHAASAYYCSPWEEALVITADGKGDGQSAGAYVGGSDGLSLQHSVSQAFSIGQMYQAVTAYLGYKPNRHEGKITGLAAYGDGSKHLGKFEDVLSLNHGEMRNRLLEDQELQRSPDKYYRERVVHKGFISSAYVRSLNGSLKQFGIVHQLYQNYLRQKFDGCPPEDVAAAVQLHAEESLEQYARTHLKAHLPCNVCLAGGVFANVKINQRIREIEGVEGFYVQQAMDDAGCALGAALQVTAQKLGPSAIHRPTLDSVYLGPTYSEAVMEKELRHHGLRFRKSDRPEAEVARLLAEGKVVARFNTALEWGPRALGNRSILVQPQNKSINRTLNERLRRTEFMPFAPAILAEQAERYLVGYSEEDIAARYMTVTYDIVPEFRAEIAAAVHIDGTARPQVVYEEDNRSFYRIISEYWESTGIPAIMNTSFNMHEEPIVNTPGDAVRSFQEGAADVLSMGPFIVT